MTGSIPCDTKLNGSIESELDDLLIDTLFTARGNQVAGTRWMVIADVLGLPSSMVSALLAGGAGVSVIVGDNTTLTAFLAFASALMSSANSFLQPERRAVSFSTKGNKCVSIRNRAKLLRNVGLRLPNATMEDQYEALQSLRAEYDALLLEEPLHIPTWAYHRAKKSIHDGESDYVLKQAKGE